MQAASLDLQLRLAGPKKPEIAVIMDMACNEQDANNADMAQATVEPGAG